MQKQTRQGRENEQPIADAQIHQITPGTHENRRRSQQSDGENSQCHAAGNRDPDQLGEDAVGPLPISGAHGHGNQGGAAGADHNADGAEKHDVGHDQIHRGKGGFTHVIGYEKAVHHAVDGGKEHHNHGGHGKTQQFFVCEMLG